MQSVAPPWIISFFFTTFVTLFSPSISCTFTLTNNCPYTIWPGTLAGAGTPQLPTTGFQLSSGASVRIPATPRWSGRIWARTGCTFDGSGIGTCQTGNCGGRLECDGMGAEPPASLFEITLGAGQDKDYYDVSLVDGYNLPLVVIPQGVSGGCNATGCVADVNMGCPKELQVVGDDADEYNSGGGGGGGRVVACKSACEAFGLDQYCCSGQFANPTTCTPSFYSSIFKRACPRAYSYAFDDGTSTFTCNAYDYSIVFCPTPDRMKRSPGPPVIQGTTPGPPVIQGATPGPPVIQGATPGPPIIQGATPGPPMIQGATPGPPVIQGATPGPPVIQGATPGPPIIQGATPGPPIIQGATPSPLIIQGATPSPPVTHHRHSNGQISDMVSSSSNILLPISLTATIPPVLALNLFF